MGEAPLASGGASGAGGATKRMAHPGLLAGLLLVALAVPLLAFGRGTSNQGNHVQGVASVKAGARLTSPEAELADPASATTVAATTPSTVAPATTAASTTAAPTTDAPAASSPEALDAAAPRAAAPVTVAVRPVATAPKPAPKPAPTAAPKPAPAPARSRSGQGTWYRYKAGGCANNELPKGTVVQVTNVATGASATCVVNDRGAFGYPTILDMDASVFSQIAPLGAGRISIVISW